MTAEERTATTYRLERWRAISAGINEAAAVLFLLLIAVRWYGASPLAKALVAGGGSLGLLLSPWLVSRVEASGLPVARAAARLAAVGAGSFLVMALFPTLPIFVAGSVVAMTTSSAAIPLLTQIYQDNYPTRQRGRLFARAMMIRIATAAVFCELGGRLLSSHLGLFRWLLLIFAAGGAAGYFCLLRCPSRPLAISVGTHPFRALRFVKQDRVFRQTLIAWMFIGFAMLMMSPLRVEYLANPKYGVSVEGQMLTAAMIALLTGVIPNLARLVLNPIWGWLFDHINFFVLRLMLNLGFALGILSFFTTGSMPGLIMGALLFGIANAGADVAWGLWVTKFAPPERVADYMSVHTFFTGVRGVLAPLAAFLAVARLSPHTLGWISIGLILVGSAFLVPEIRIGKRPRAGEASPIETSPTRE
jgi:MFS family permease